MSRAVRRTLAAAVATALALTALLPVLHGSDWIVRGLGAVAVVAGTGLLTRQTRVPRALQPLVALLALVAYLLVVFVPGTFSHGLPTGDTVDALRALVRSGTRDLRRYAPPLVPAQGLLLLSTAGIGAVALLVDLCAVTLDRPVVSGLPLLALFAVPSSLLPGGIGGLAFVVGVSGWLLLLLEEGGDRTEQWGRLMRATVPGAKVAPDDGSLARVGRRIGAAALGLAVLVPNFLPGLDHQLAGGSGGGAGKGDGPSSATTYNPITKLQEQLTLPRPRQLFVYTSDDPHPDYLRMTTLDTYTVSGWQSSLLQADPQQARVQKGLSPGVGEAGPTQDLTMRMAVDGDHLDVHWLPLPFGPRSVDVAGSWLWDPTSQTAFSAARTTRALPPYTVRASRPVPTRDALENADPAYPEAMSRYLSPPVVTPFVADLARQVTKGRLTAYDRAVAIQQWFTTPSNGFVYDLKPPLARGGQDPLQAFLTGKRGFCQQYASAMAAMLRVAGVPSRVAVGFTPGQKVGSRQNTWSVTTSDAHAWPEAWFAGTGWVRFEPTPGTARATLPDYTRASTPGPGTPTPTPAPSASASASPRLFKDPDQLLRPEAGGGAGTAGPVAGHRATWVLLGVLLVLLAAAPATGTVLRRRSRSRRADPDVAWDQLRDDVRDAGRQWLPAESPRAAAARLSPSLPADGAEALRRLAHAVEVARYAPAGRRSPVDLTADGTAVRRALLATAPRATRWRARALPPSTLRWASHALGEGAADLLDAIDRGLSWAGRPLRRVLRAG